MNDAHDSHREELISRIRHHLAVIYPESDQAALCARLLEVMRIEEPKFVAPHRNLWDETDIALITYADTISNSIAPLKTLKDFIDRRLQDHISTVHILPFYPYSSDDGFAVIDYSSVNESFGSWEDIRDIAGSYKVMADVVINHVSARSRWFENYKKGVSPGKGYFIEADPNTDLSMVVRPRTSPLLTPVETVDGEKHLWCTFSADQVDMNFANPEVLVEFAKIISLYIDFGVRWFRLDAVAFLWKEIGTPCIHLQPTHEIIKLLRLLIETRTDDGIVVTETNVPIRENLTYFGNANQAHLIYNFSLPPLIIHTLISGDCRHLKTWIMSMPPAQQGTCYLNFIASHDGVGVRPIEGLLSDEETARLLKAMETFGGAITYRELGGVNKPYEINIALFDALAGTTSGGRDEWQVQRFICAHGVMLALEGIPAFYIHSLFGTPNDHGRVEHTGRPRSINRHIWHQEQLELLLDDASTSYHQIFEALTSLIAIRKRQPAFHPNATQFTLHLGTEIFGFWRQSIDRRQSIFAIYNVSANTQTISLSDLNLIDAEPWVDLVCEAPLGDIYGDLILQPYQFVWLTNRPQ